ncbi:MAG TPA: sulfite exporter TauE/SafE family protein [Gaiellaceae bacterium]|nr:sulfite exporter TauE/SafE family protein [Gaiellaceae bacterium]
MTLSTVLLGLALGLSAGVLAGMFGVGGGILFVPTLVALGLGQLEAQATSLLAILPTVAAGAWNQRRYGNLRARAALVVGVSSVAGVEVGARLATSMPEDVLRRLFALLLFAVAAQLVWRARRSAARSYSPSS